MTIEHINRMELDAFVAAFGAAFEHSPWVAARAWPHRPFADLSAMHEAMIRQVLEASRDEQLALLRAHPDLGARARMSVASEGEQAGAGLDRLTAGQYDRLRAANARYRDRFGFPFLCAVRGSTASDILTALEARVNGTWEAEFQTALQQVFRIARFRLQDLVQ
jgi:2-oxo-4-hydroxy-4-carboxy-5-ureidoimidazoline decarboxylase